ncbi:MAG TPA: hypothetical protein VKV74_07570 [Bryobacteraceae bacterium]|nr:hypothetical protein [Bryobacteraceae bacterium]
MCKSATACGGRLRPSGAIGILFALLGFLLGGSLALGQVAADWYHSGNSLLDFSLAGLATGPVDRVWYSADGRAVFIATASHKLFQTNDFDSWAPAQDLKVPPVPVEPRGVRQLPEANARVRAAAQGPGLYAFGRFVYRSLDGGSNWDNLTAFGNQSLVGPDLRDLAVSPQNPEEVVVAGAAGVFRSLDGGKSWSGLNQGLPNLPWARIRDLPSGDRGVQLELAEEEGQGGGVVEWGPGEKQAWRPADSSTALGELALRRGLSRERGIAVTAMSTGQNGVIYLGTANGTISVSSDGGRSWPQTFATNGGPVEAFWVDPNDPRIALAALGAKAQDAAGAAPHLARTENGGVFWDDLKLDLPVHGVTASRTSAAIYVATDRGVYYSHTDLNSLAGPGRWQAVTGLPEGPVTDVRLDSGENRLWAVVEGFGVYSALAPHRLGDPRVVSAADMAARAVAPGALMSVLGARITGAKWGDLPVPVLAAGEAESEIQIPFEAEGSRVALSLAQATGRSTMASLALQSASPAIVVDRDGAPILLDANAGTLLDSMNPAHSGARVQIWATGLGRVHPEWPTGLAAPLENPPAVVAPVHAMLDRSPAQVTRATLAAGYIGFYLVEIEIPKVVNSGPAELYLEADGHQSNPVRIYIQP